MRKTRFMSLLFLIWSIAFFFVPEFRQAFQALILGESMMGATKFGELPEGKIRALAQAAEQRREAGTLAFAAMHAPFPSLESCAWRTRQSGSTPSLAGSIPKYFPRCAKTGTTPPR